jgi:hypothetical protein
MPNDPSPYFGKCVVMTTKHAKSIAVAPGFKGILGAAVVEYPVDTDALGTFSGGIERQGSALDCVRRKCELGMDLLNAEFGIASEGCFGPHPFIPFIPGGHEILYFIDRKRKFHLHASRLSEQTNYRMRAVDLFEPLQEFAAETQFPSRALVVLEMVTYVADRIADADEIQRSRQFPYQYLAAYLNVEANVPQAIRDALGRAAETACGNVPRLPEPIVIGVDVSGSMASAITGQRGRGATSKVRCVDVAALFAAALVRRNPDSVVVPFDTAAYRAEVGASETILDLASRLAHFGGGGTDCSLPLAEANQTYHDRRFAGCVLVSDMESWVGTGRAGSTGVMTQWQMFVANQKRLHGGDGADPKLVCIDLQAYATSQAPERADILNIGGFSDAVFKVVASFLSGEPERFVGEVEAMEL